jgi:hypothetical protein
MSNLNTLIKKRQKIEAQILEAQRLEKRRAEVLALLEKAGAFSLTDAQILSLSALQPKATQPSFADHTTNGSTP